MSATVTHPVTDFERCERLVERLAAATGEHWTFGYLGNVCGRSDDRRWYAFNPRPKPTPAIYHHIGGVPSTDLGRLAEMLSGALQFARYTA